MTNVTPLPSKCQPPDGPIAFIDLKAQQARIRAGVEQRLGAVLDHGRYIAGPEIEELEDRLAAWTGARGVVTCGSGTDALIIPLLAPGPSYGRCSLCAGVHLQRNGKCRFVDRRSTGVRRY